MPQLSTTWAEKTLQLAQAHTLSNKNPWLQAWSADQLARFLQCGFPRRRDEDWKYTSTAAVEENEFSMSTENFVVTNNLSNILASYLIPNTYRVVFINGCFYPNFSKLPNLPEQIQLTHTAKTMHKPQQLYTASSAFVALNGALLSDGLSLSIADHCRLETPVHLLYLTVHEPQHVAVMHHPRHILRLGNHSSATVFEEYIGLSSGTYWNNILTEVNVKRGAQLHYYKLQRENISGIHIANTVIHQQQDSQVFAHHVAAGAKLHREDLDFGLAQAGAQCHLTGFYYANSQQHIDFHTRIVHEQAHTDSQQYYKGILTGSGRGVFNGKIIVRPQAQHIHAKQANHNLLLSKTAEINTKPELAVYADNVHCTHGATVGHLDDQALFYLRSRGIEESSARHLLLCGFAEEIWGRWFHAQIADYIRPYIISQLER